jgi:hypothetical protein
VGPCEMIHPTPMFPWRSLVRRTILFIAFLLSFCALAPAQTPSSSVKEITAWPDGWVNINDGWRFQLGDDPAYAKPDFDDSHWQVVSLRARPAIAGPGMRWYRLHLKLPAAHPPLGLFLILPKNGYEVFVNGTRVGDGRIGSALEIYRPYAQSVQLPAGAPDMVLVVRSMDLPYQDVAENMESLQFAGVGLWPVVQWVKRGYLTENVAFLGSSMAMDIAVCLGGLAVLSLFLIQRTRREYLWLCAYLMVASLSRPIQLPPIFVSALLGQRAIRRSALLYYSAAAG